MLRTDNVKGIRQGNQARLDRGYREYVGYILGSRSRGVAIPGDRPSA